MAVPAPKCDVGEEPRWPGVNTAPCGDQVCVSPADAAEIWLYRREVERYLERVRLCHDAQEEPRVPLTINEVKYQTDGVDFRDIIRSWHSGVDRVVTDLTFPGMVVNLEWELCGEVNGYYTPRTKVLTMCYEALDGGLAKAIAAHEMGHAMHYQLALPVPGNEEDAADELAAWYLTTHGGQNDLLKLAHYFIENDYVSQDPYAQHTRPATRAAWFECWAEGSQGETGFCTRKWRDLIRHWNVILENR